MGDLNWTDDQWRKVKDAVTDSFGKASVASAFLPLFGPLSPGAETVRNERLSLNASKEPPIVSLDSNSAGVNQPFVNVTVKVLLSSEQVADENLGNALLAFRRAANLLAQQEDDIVFNGYYGGSNYVTNTVTTQGLGELAARVQRITPQEVKDLRGIGIGIIEPTGPLLITAVVKAISSLDRNSNTGPFACVLGNGLFEAAHEPSSYSLVLPSDRLLPLLRGPLLRCSQLDDNTGVVVSLAANAVDLVVATPPTVQFLQRNEDAKYVFRVYTRFTLRVRDSNRFSPVVKLQKT